MAAGTSLDESGAQFRAEHGGQEQRASYVGDGPVIGACRNGYGHNRVVSEAATNPLTPGGRGRAGVRDAMDAVPIRMIPDGGPCVWDGQD